MRTVLCAGGGRRSCAHTAHVRLASRPGHSLGVAKVCVRLRQLRHGLLQLQLDLRVARLRLLVRAARLDVLAVRARKPRLGVRQPRPLLSKSLRTCRRAHGLLQ